jgi:hypothetical protein
MFHEMTRIAQPPGTRASMTPSPPYTSEVTRSLRATTAVGVQWVVFWLFVRSGTSPLLQVHAGPVADAPDTRGADPDLSRDGPDRLARFGCELTDATGRLFVERHATPRSLRRQGGNPRGDDPSPPLRASLPRDPQMLRDADVGVATCSEGNDLAPLPEALLPRCLSLAAFAVKDGCGFGCD